MGALPALVVVWPIAGACALLVLGRILPRPAVDGLALLIAAVLVFLTVRLLVDANRGPVVTWAGNWQPMPHRTVGIVLVADRFAAALVVLIAGLTAVALLFGWHYFDNLRAHYPALVLLFAAGMCGFALTGDLFDMFVFFELMSVAAYALTGLEIEDPESVQGGLNFGVINSLGAYLCLFGIGLLYAHTGQLGLAQLAGVLAGQQRETVVVVAFALISTGWLVKAAVTPFHFWLADAHAVAPAPVCVLFSGVMAPLGVYGVARLYWATFTVAIPSVAVHRMSLVLAVLTMVVGTVMCMLQRHLKRMLAYSTIAHSGMFLLGVSTLSPAGIAASAIYLCGHAAVKGALFLMAGALLAHYESLDEHRLYGRARRHRLLGVLFVTAAVLLAGFPWSATGLGKALLEESGHSVVLGVLVIAVSAGTGGVVLRAGLRIFWGLGRRPATADDAEETTGAREESDTDTPPGRTPATMLTAVLMLLLAAVTLGLPGVLGAGTGSAAGAFCDPAGYTARALHTVPAALPPAPPEVGWTGIGLGLAALSTTAAVLVAVLGLARVSRATPAGPVRMLHRLHSGHLGDYSAWLVTGCALLTGLLWLP
ncbi:complex I subunit 5 family protein [Nocardia sp. BMG111209]|uniref:complex I subunit 5 family protein n=1 Tax=Nocardia sp. BMG111209 TaxID=1160137 RepID=UPI00037EFB5E|nr:complex I subunit 5 family protein [Nocardia sp. BMG111209]